MGTRGSELSERPPQDAALDRRAFLGRMATLSAAAAAGAGAAVPLVGGGGALDAASASTEVAGGSGGRATGSERAPEIASAPPWTDSAYAASVRPEALADAAELTVAEAAELIRRRRLSPLELVEAYLQRIERLDGVYRAFNLVLADESRREAVRLMSARHLGPLHGIPLALKDLFYTAGVRTTANSFVFQDFVPAYDATAVARLRAAGAIILGKTQMGPLATTRATTPTGQITTVNAWAPQSPNVSPGGSSSGSATAVAARLAASSMGSQTGGSITAPANAQGLTGLKPTVGRVSLRGVIPLSYTRDSVGPIARDALDAAILLQAVAGADPVDVRTAGTPPVPDFVRAATPVTRRGRLALRWPTRVGVPPGYTDGDSEGAAARSAMLQTFEELGAQLVEVPLPEDWTTLTGVFNNIRLVERAEPFLPYLKQDVRLFGVSLSTWINGLLLSGDEFLKGQRAKLLLLQRVLDDVFGACDVVVQTSPVPFDILGLPEIAFPIGFSGGAAQPRPIGAILGGLPFGEERLLSVVAGYQAATDWHRRRPTDPAPGEDPGQLGQRGRIRADQLMDLSE